MYTYPRPVPFDRRNSLLAIPQRSFPKKQTRESKSKRLIIGLMIAFSILVIMCTFMLWVMLLGISIVKHDPTASF